MPKWWLKGWPHIFLGIGFIVFKLGGLAMRFGGLWLGLVWLFAAGDLAAQVPATTGVVDGEVVDGVTGTPIANARVKLKKEPEDLYAGVDGEGHFRFAGLAPAGYSLSVESPGFLPATPTYVSLVSDANPEADGLIRSEEIGRAHV